MSGAGNKPLSEQDFGWLMGTIDKVVVKQRPLVVAHLQELRKKKPGLSPAQTIARLERQYLAAVTGGGAAVGATAIAPGVGTAASLGLTAAETVVFLEASAFFAQAVAEVHGVPSYDPERSRALVMSLMLGSAGSSVVRRVAAQAVGRGAAGNAFWGSLVTQSLPGGFMGTLVEQLRKILVKRFATTTGASMLGRAMPFGIGAVIGGLGNHILGRQIVTSARDAFGPAPERFTTHLDPIAKPERQKRTGRDTRSITQGVDDARAREAKGVFHRRRGLADGTATLPTQNGQEDTEKS